jgi:hypothetical protein
MPCLTISNPVVQGRTEGDIEDFEVPQCFNSGLRAFL